MLHPTSKGFHIHHEVTQIFRHEIEGGSKYPQVIRFNFGPYPQVSLTRAAHLVDQFLNLSLQIGVTRLRLLDQPDDNIQHTVHGFCYLIDFVIPLDVRADASLSSSNTLRQSDQAVQGVDNGGVDQETRAHNNKEGENHSSSRIDQQRISKRRPNSCDSRTHFGGSIYDLLPMVFQMEKIKIGLIQIRIRRKIVSLLIKLFEYFVLKQLVRAPVSTGYCVEGCLLISNHLMPLIGAITCQDTTNDTHVVGGSNFITLLIARECLAEVDCQGSYISTGQFS